MKRFAQIPDEGERNRDDLVKMLFDYAAKLTLLGNWCDFHFDAWSDCAGHARINWYIGDAQSPEYGNCLDNLYLSGGIGFDEDKCTDWIDGFHEFLWRHENGLDVHGNTSSGVDATKCIHCGYTNIVIDKDCNAPWCKNCNDWAHLKRPAGVES